MSAATTILLTGATGFLGSHLARRFLADGYRVVVISRQPNRPRRIQDLAVAAYPPEEIARVFSEHTSIQAVVHTATCYGRQGEPDSAIFEANSVFPARVLEMASEVGVKIFLNTDTPLPLEVNTYSLTKAQFRTWGERFASRGCIRFLNLRLEHFYGPGDDDTKFPTYVIRSCLRNVPDLQLTAGEQQRDFIFIDDVVDAFALILKHALSLANGFHDVSLGTGQPITIRKFVEEVHRMTGSRTRLQFGALPYRAHEMMLSTANTQRLKGLGWRCRNTLETGLRKTIEGEQRL